MQSTSTWVHSKHLVDWFVEADHLFTSRRFLVLRRRASFVRLGPGCCSIGNGLLTVSGPFGISSSGNLTFYKHSWNRATDASTGSRALQNSPRVIRRLLQGGLWQYSHRNKFCRL